MPSSSKSSSALASTAPAPTLPAMMMFQLYRAWSAGNPIFIRLCEGRFNITRREWRILAIACMHPALTGTALAEAVSLDSARCSRAVSTLCEKGLLKRTRDIKDTRVVHVSVTELGMQRYKEVMPIVASLNEEIFQDLSAAEMAALSSMLDRITSRAALMLESNVVKERARRNR
ncbi:MarR family winged helix-turn-helix transcriptional regulator [Alcaligenes faecalis]|uniref:MarR family winged helix-turn-helix transcriptional regulator n=1 Tax=Alcaligenes faecalis TaxID=511 RepID=UPI001C82D5BF|nr:MarR family transcriptional regulator [Alcaligenes faecalis]MBX6964434.1 MarR family transcriptional regulator [Providencia rettgeri]MBX7032520.1 MarR family transcriptional regulator [Alcaligenes faecalis]